MYTRLLYESRELGLMTQGVGRRGPNAVFTSGELGPLPRSKLGVWGFSDSSF